MVNVQAEPIDRPKLQSDSVFYFHHPRPEINGLGTFKPFSQTIDATVPKPTNLDSPLKPILCQPKIDRRSSSFVFGAKQSAVGIDHLFVIILITNRGSHLMPMICLIFSKPLS